MEQIGVFRDNIGDESVLAKVVKAIVFEQLDPEIFKIVVEMNFNGKAFLKEFSSHENYFDGLIMHSYHSAPVPGEAAPRKKPGFKTGNDREYFLKLGKKLIGDKIIIPTEEETYYELNAFGKSKSGKYQGIARHDDLAMTELNLSRLYKESEYADWLYDFLEELPDSPEKKYAMKILQEPYDESDMSDEEFKIFYTDSEQLDLNILNNPFYR